MSKIDFSHLIESYLDGSISKENRNQLFEAMEKDPALKSEFQLQSNVIESLKTYRKAELKARLASIEVGSGASSFIGLKIASVAVISALLFTGAYYVYQAQNPTLDLVPVAIEKQTIEPEVIPSVPSPPLEQAPVVAKKQEVKESKTIAENPLVQPSVEQVANNKPVVIEPNLISDLDEKEVVMGEEQPSFANNTLTETTEKAKPAVEIVSEVGHSKGFEYKFFSNKLYLYGDFGKIPYEILELNSSLGKRLFLFYQNEYYSLKMNQKERIPLEKVVEQKLVKELEIIKNNK